MSTDPRAGTPARPRTSSTSTRCWPPTTTGIPIPSDPGAAGGVRHLRAPRLVAEHHVQRRPHRRHQPGHRRVPGRARAPTGRCSSAATPTRCPSRPGSPRSRCSPANDVHVLVDSADGYTPTPARVARDPAAQPRPHRRACRRRRRHPVAQPAPDGGFKYNPPQRRPGRHRRHQLDRRTAPTSCCSRSWTGCGARPLDPCAASSGRYDFLGEYVDRPALRRRPGRDPGRAGCGSAPTRSAGPAWPTGARSPSGTGSTSPWSTRRRPAVRVHDPRLGRQDPDGLLVAVRDGLAGGSAATEYHDRHRQRRRLRPARHRHRRAGLMNPNHFLAVAIGYLYAHRPDWPPDAGDRQDGRQLVDDRPGGRRPGPQAGGDARRVQVVRRRACSTARIGFGGEESAGASFLRTRRRGVDHRQGRHHPGPARRRRSSR